MSCDCQLDRGDYMTIVKCRLCAAAPKLLEALEALLNEMEWLGRESELCEKARAAIAKAKIEKVQS